MKRYLLICTAALALTGVHCFPRGDDVLTIASTSIQLGE